MRTCAPRALLSLTVLAMAAGAAGCDGDGPTRPVESPPESPLLLLTIPRVDFAAPQDSTPVELAAQRGDGTRVSAPTDTRLMVESEPRRFASFPVFLEAGLERGMLIPTGPGSVRIAAVAPGHTPAAVDVRVSPAGAVVAELVQKEPVAAGNTVWVRGMNLLQLETRVLRLPPADVHAAVVTDSLLGFPIAAVAAEGCADVLHWRSRLTEPAWHLGGELVVRVHNEAPLERVTVQLQPGETLRFAADPGVCLRPSDGSEPADHMLIYMDPRQIVAARTARRTVMRAMRWTSVCEWSTKHTRPTAAAR